MNNEFAIKPLVVMIAAALALSGCNTETATNTVNESEPVAEAQSAQVKLGVKFPQSEVGAAWIGSVTMVEVRFFKNDYVGTLDEAEDFIDGTMNCHRNDHHDDMGDDKPDDPMNDDSMADDSMDDEPTAASNRDGHDGHRTFMIGEQEVDCDEADDNLLAQRFAREVELNTSSPTTTVDLIPGKYRVEAEFYTEDDTLRETSVSYVTLGEGTHSIALRGIAATWTAETPLELMLLNKASSFDWDPGTDGTQTPADVLGLSGNLLGLHLPSLYNYPEGLPTDMRAMADLTDLYHPLIQTRGDFDEGTAALYVPVWRVATDSGEKDVHPDFGMEEMETDTGRIEYGTEVSLAALWQEYDGSKNNSYPELGFRAAVVEEMGESISTGQYAVLEFGAPAMASSESETRRYQYGEHSYQYWDHETQQTVMTDLRIAEIRTEIESDEWAALFFDVLNAKANQVVDGSTITGFMIEAIEMETGSETTAMPAAYLDASLNEIAEQQGLIAQPSAECNTTTGSEVEYSNQYLWDEENMRWVAGTINQLAEGQGGNYAYTYDSERDNMLEQVQFLQGRINELSEEISRREAAGETQDQYQFLIDERTGHEATLGVVNGNLQTLDTINTTYQSTADYNNDGTADIFEVGVYLEKPWEAKCDLNIEYGNNFDRTYTLNCENTDTMTTVKAWQQARNIEMCVTEFTLKASELSVDYPTDGEVVIE